MVQTVPTPGRIGAEMMMMMMDNGDGPSQGTSRRTSGLFRLHVHFRFQAKTMRCDVKIWKKQTKHWVSRLDLPFGGRMICIFPSPVPASSSAYLCEA